MVPRSNSLYFSTLSDIFPTFSDFFPTDFFPTFFRYFSDIFLTFFQLFSDHLGIIWGPSGDHLGSSGAHPGVIRGHFFDFFSTFFRLFFNCFPTIWGPSGDHLGTIRDPPPHSYPRMRGLWYTFRFLVADPFELLGFLRKGASCDTGADGPSTAAGAAAAPETN